jgi:hypothetical protein
MANKLPDFFRCSFAFGDLADGEFCTELCGRELCGE